MSTKRRKPRSEPKLTISVMIGLDTLARLVKKLKKSEIMREGVAEPDRKAAAMQWNGIQQAIKWIAAMEAFEDWNPREEFYTCDDDG